MDSTPVSLLQRLQGPAIGPKPWQQMVQLYTPLLHGWARRLGLQDADAADLVQDVMLHLFRKLPTFPYDPGKSFRAWLSVVLVNKWRENARRRAPAAGRDALLKDVAVPDPLTALAEDEYRQQLVGRALQIMQADFQPTTWRACWALVVEGEPAAAVAARLGVTLQAVYQAKSRVLHRLRNELDGLLG
jgi:RNA polymerase sigma-70 factor (ECF subfamily)